MSKLDTKGCQEITQKLCQYFDQLMLSAMSNEYNKSKDFARNIIYDCETLQHFLSPSIQPPWLNETIVKCKEFVALNANNHAQYATRVMELRTILVDLPKINWDDIISDANRIDIDAEYSKITKANHIDEAIEKLINCLVIMAAEPSFHFNKQTQVDIETLINGLRGSKKASDSAIRTLLVSTGELIKEMLPYVDKVEKSIKVMKNFKDAFNEVYAILDNARYRIAEELTSKFCLGEKIVPQLETRTILQLDFDQQDKNQ